MFRNVITRLLRNSNRIQKPVGAFSIQLKAKLPTVIATTQLKTYHNLWALSVLGWLGFEKTDEEKEDELIMTLKRAVLCTQREEFDKAEQMLHLALRLAQQRQDMQGTLYCYDLMANLAFDRLQLEKAQKLFVTVMQMLLSSGTAQDDLKVVHISLKLARINHLLAEEEKADLGYNWCLKQIENKTSKDFDSQVLTGVIHDWYAQFLLDRNQVEESLKHLKEAYSVCLNVKGKINEQSMLLLNDLGITSWRAGDMAKAEEFLEEAVKIGKALDDQLHVGVVHANLGLIYLQNGMSAQAQKYCKDAWRLGKKHENTESIEQANYCLEQIKEFYSHK